LTTLFLRRRPRSACRSADHLSGFPSPLSHPLPSTPFSSPPPPPRLVWLVFSQESLCSDEPAYGYTRLPLALSGAPVTAFFTSVPPPFFFLDRRIPYLLPFRAFTFFPPLERGGPSSPKLQPHKSKPTPYLTVISLFPTLSFPFPNRRPRCCLLPDKTPKTRSHDAASFMYNRIPWSLRPDPLPFPHILLVSPSPKIYVKRRLLPLKFFPSTSTTHPPALLIPISGLPPRSRIDTLCTGSHHSLPLAMPGIEPRG